MKILVLNGPNLNMLGTREPGIYGTATYADIVTLCEKTIRDAGYEPDVRQSNHEGELVTWIQEAAQNQFTGAGSPQTASEGLGKQIRPDNNTVGVVINAGAYTHTSLAIHDALRLLSCPIAEVHLSDPKAREPFRHHSYVEALAFTSIVGKGADGYKLAIEAVSKKLKH